MDPSLSSGAILFILAVSAALTAPLSFFLLRLYRRAVLRGMNVTAGATDAAPPSVAPTPPSHPLRITTLGSGSEPITTEGKSRFERAAALSLRRVMLAYVAAGVAFAAVFAGAWSAQAGDGFFLSRFLVLTVDFSWPVVLALSQLAALGRRDWLRFIGLYLLIFVAVTIFGLSRSVFPDLLSLIGLWLTSNILGTLLLLASLTRRIRSVGPLVLTFMAAGMTGALLLTSIIWNSSGGISGVVQILKPTGLSGRGMFAVVVLAGFAILGVAGWRLLRMLGRWYQQKRMSDLALTLDAMWLLFAITNSIVLAAYDWRWLLTGAVAFGVYKLVLWAAFAWIAKPATADGQSPTLLLLRVFSLGPRSLRLFDALAKHWLRTGPIVLIAGPDLVTGIVEPPEFLDFVGGRVSRQFVQGRDDLAQRLAQLDTRPDPDGRHRTNAFFCRADTWQMTMQQLAAGSDAVLMDLRSFSPTNRGCLYELGRLLSSVPLPQVLITVDDTTDLVFLGASLQELWRSVPADSPNRSLPDPEVRLYRVRSGTGAEVRTLLSLLFRQLGSTTVINPAGTS